jgi:hypothetical protein
MLEWVSNEIEKQISTMYNSSVDLGERPMPYIIDGCIIIDIHYAAICTSVVKCGRCDAS